MSHVGCPVCTCVIAAPAHALLACLLRDDVDRALDGGLLDTQGCPSCTPECNHRLLAARDERRFALAARDRFRARQSRLDTRAAQREAARRVKPAAHLPALPAGAAAVLQRALAKAAAKP
jgi:hypothetical protein